MMYGMRQQSGIWQRRARSRTCSTPGAHFYDTYETRRTASYVSIGSIEPQFYAELLEKLSGLDGEDLPRSRWIATAWPAAEGAA